MRLLLFVALIIVGCNPAPHVPMTPPVFNKGDKVKVSITETGSPVIGLVIDVHQIPTGGTSGFRGWKYRIMFPDTTIEYVEDQLSLYEKMKWVDDTKPIAPTVPTAPVK